MVGTTIIHSGPIPHMEELSRMWDEAVREHKPLVIGRPPASGRISFNEECALRKELVESLEILNRYDREVWRARLWGSRGRVR